MVLGGGSLGEVPSGNKSVGFFQNKSDGFIREEGENGHMLIYLSKTMREITSDSKSVSFTE